MARPCIIPEDLKDKRINIRITAKKLKELKELCKKENITLSKFVKKAIYQQYKIIIF